METFRQKKMFQERLDFLITVREMIENGEKDRAMQMVKDYEKEILGEINALTYQRQDSQRPEKINDTIRRLRSLSLLCSDEFIELVPITTDEDAKRYIQVRAENEITTAAFIDKDGYEKIMIDDVLDENTFYCSIYDVDTDDYMGYCGINNVNTEEWELAVELLKEYQGRGYGYRVMTTFMNCIKAETGCGHFITRVDPENTASQKLMKKLGFQPAGITTLIIKDEKKLAEFEEEGMERLDGRMKDLAVEFDVEPRKLLSHVLVYKIDM